MEREKEDRLIGQLREQANDLLAAVHLLTPLVRSQGAEKDTQCLAAMNQSLYRLIRCVNHMELCRESQPLFHPALLDLAGLCRDMGRQLELLEDALQVHFWWELEKESIITLADDALFGAGHLEPDLQRRGSRRPRGTRYPALCDRRRAVPHHGQ